MHKEFNSYHKLSYILPQVAQKKVLKPQWLKPTIASLFPD